MSIFGLPDTTARASAAKADADALAGAVTSFGIVGSSIGVTRGDGTFIGIPLASLEAAIGASSTPAETATIVTPSGSYTTSSPVQVSGTLANGSVLYVAALLGGTQQGSRVLATINGPNWGANVPAAAAGSYTFAAYAAATGGAALATSGAVTVATAATSESPNGTTVTTVGPIITDAAGNTRAINSGGQVVTNGTADTNTANVVKLVYYNHLFYQANAAGAYYSQTAPGATYVLAPNPSVTSVTSANGTLVSTVGPSITDTHGNTFAINSSTQDVFNNVADTGSVNVTQIYFDGTTVYFYVGGTWKSVAVLAAPYPNFTLTTVSNPVVAAPTLTVTGISPVTPGSSSTVSLTYANGAPTGFTAKVDGTAVTISGVAVAAPTSGTGATATGTAVFQITCPVAASHTLVATGTGTYAAVSPSYGFTSASAGTNESPNGTIVSTVGPVITDGNNNTYGLNSSGQVVTNGIADTNTANVSRLAYYNHLFYQENAAGAYYSRTTPTASYILAPDPTAALAPSASGTSVTTVGPTIMDSLRHIYSINSSGQIVQDKVADTGTAGVTQLYYANSVLYMNSGNGWQSRTVVAASYPNATYASVPNPVGASATISAPTIIGKTAGGTTQISGSFSFGAPAGLTHTLDGGTAVSIGSPNIVITSGSGASAVGTYAYSFATPTQGAHTLSVTGVGGSNTASSSVTSFSTYGAATFDYYQAAANNKITRLGVNFSGAENGGQYPLLTSNARIDYFTGMGFNTFRICGAWERWTPTLGGAIDMNYANQILGMANYIASESSNNRVVIDALHNYAKYNGVLIGASGGPTVAQFGATWGQISTILGNNPQFELDLCNEPLCSLTTWLQSAQAACTAIRGSAGGNARNLIWVESAGGSYGGTMDGVAGTVSAMDAGGYTDPIAHGTGLSGHFYWDNGQQGDEASVESTNAAVNALTPAVNACKNSPNNYKLFYGEWGAGNDSASIAEATLMLNFAKANSATLVELTQWGARPNFDPSYWAYCGGDASDGLFANSQLAATYLS